MLATSSNHTHQTSLAAMYVKLVFVALFWGGTFIAGRIASQSVGPFAAAFIRFAVAAVILLVAAYRIGGGLPRLSWRETFLVTLLGATGVIAYNFFFFSGLREIAASRAALVIALNPVGVTLTAALLMGDKLTPLRMLGVGTALCGAVFVITQGNFSNVGLSVGVGELLIGGCVVSWVAYTLIGRIALESLSPLIATTYACLIGCAGLAPMAWLEGVDFVAMSWQVWTSLVYLGLFGTSIGFLWYYDGVRTIGPSRASIFINLVPVCAVTLGILLLGETLAAATLWGGLLVIIGVMLTNRRASTRTQE